MLTEYSYNPKWIVTKSNWIQSDWARASGVGVGVFWLGGSSGACQENRTEQDQHNNTHIHAHTHREHIMSHTGHEWRSLLLLVLLLLLLKGNNCTQKYYDPIWTGLFFRISFLRFWFFFCISLLCVFDFVAAAAERHMLLAALLTSFCCQANYETHTHDTPHSNHSDRSTSLSCHTHIAHTCAYFLPSLSSRDKLNLCAN